MDASADILVIGGGIAGLSAAAALARHASVIVVEAEEQIGFHSSGRSATMLHYALGDSLVRSLTLASRAFFERPPEGFCETPLATRVPLLVHAREDEIEELAALEREIAPFAALEALDPGRMRALCPALRVGAGAAVAGLVDPRAIRLDSHALLQGFARRLRSTGGRVVTGASVTGIARRGRTWSGETDRAGSVSTPLLVNASGAWADRIAELAGLRRIGLSPLRRTVITLDPPPGLDVGGWPFTKTIRDALYFAPESGRLFASPMDELPTDPCDAQPDEHDIALAAHRVEKYTTIRVERIHSRWAGLRTFAPDRHPVVGFDPEDPTFFWLAGQGGFGLQTSPAVSQVVESLVAATPWPLDGVEADQLSPARFST